MAAADCPTGAPQTLSIVRRDIHSNEPTPYRPRESCFAHYFTGCSWRGERRDLLSNGEEGQLTRLQLQRARHSIDVALLVAIFNEINCRSRVIQPSQPTNAQSAQQRIHCLSAAAVHHLILHGASTPFSYISPCASNLSVIALAVVRNCTANIRT